MSSDLALGSVLGANLANGAVTAGKLAADSVLGANLANSAVTTSKIANGAVENHNLTNGSVSSDKLGTGAVTAPKLAANSVTSPAIAPDSITAAQIQNGQVVEGNGTLSSAAVQLTDGQSNVPLLTFPGLGGVQADCAGGAVTIELFNNAGATIDWANWGATTTGATVENGTAANGDIVSRTSPNAFLGLTWMASYGAGPGLHLVTIDTSTAPTPTGGCVVMAQATYTS
jgi:trimeric autotransporter adhesin